MTLENIEKCSRNLMDAHGLKDWQFGFDRATARLGVTYLHGKKITLSKQFAARNTWAEIKQTMLHEIAHALCAVGVGHGRAWKEMYTSLGGTTQRDYTIIKMPPLIVGNCPNCKREVKRRRRAAIACATCCNKLNKGVYSDKYKIVWR